MLRIRFIIIVIIIIIIIITIIIIIRKKCIPINNSCGGVRCVECSVNRQTSFFSLIFFAIAGRPEFRHSLVVVAGVVGGGRDVSRVAAYSAG